MLPQLNEWQIADTSNGLVMPYYTHPALEWIKENLVYNYSVLEIGGGYSTFWWKHWFDDTTTLETNKQIAEQINAIYVEDCELLNYIKYLNSTAYTYDIVIVDTDGDRESYIIDAFELCNTFFIVDNWQQEGVSVYSEKVVDYLYSNTKEQLIFKQPNHKDWKTAIFIK